MRILCKIIIFTYLSISSLCAEIINKIEVSGNKRVSLETIKVYGEIKDLGSDFSKAELDEILKNLYSTNFFKEVNLETKNNVLIINLKEYPIINELIIIGEPSNKIKKQLIKNISLKERNSFIENNLSNDISLIKELYSTLGYNFTEVEAKVKKIDENSLDLVIEVDRGKITNISKISFTVDKKLKDKRLRDIIASEENKFWKFISKNTKFSKNLIDLDKRLLINYYKSIGYYDVEVNSTSAQMLNTSNIELTYTINSGQRYIIDKIKTNVDPVFDKKIFFPLQESYRKITGDYYSPFKIKELLEEIDEIIDENNLQFVEHNVQEKVGDKSISLQFNIFEGEKILVERINVLGNNVTNEEVIRSELLLDEGDPFTKIKLDKSISNIKSRRIFKSVTPEIKSGSSSDLKTIEIKVEEQPTGEISAGAGIGTEGGSFAFVVKENNWLGEGKRVGVDFDISSETIKGELNYVNPNYDLLGNSLRYNLTNITNDKPDQGYENKIFALGVGTSFEQFRDVYTSLGISASYDDLRTDSSASSSLKKNAGEFSEISGEYGFSIDKRNRSFMPTSGFINSFSQTIPFYADKPYIGNKITSSVYHAFNENFVGAAKFYFDAINNFLLNFINDNVGSSPANPGIAETVTSFFLSDS